MPIPGYADINGGVMIALTNLNQVTLSSDKSIVSVGPGRRWEEVYGVLEPSGLIVLGGRVGLVGVPGLLLGGGISFYSNQYGFASDNVVAYEVRKTENYFYFTADSLTGGPCQRSHCNCNLQGVLRSLLGLEGRRK